jgi:hypothetical protein
MLLEYSRVTPEQQAGLVTNREGHDNGGCNKKRPKKGSRDKAITLSRASISQMVAALKSGNNNGDADADGDADDDLESSNEIVPMKGPTKKQKIVNNCTNPALQCRNK